MINQISSQSCMKNFGTFAFLLIVCSVSAFSQKSENVLASASGIRITAKDLPFETQTTYLSSDEIISKNRARLLEEHIAQTLLELEAKANGVSVERLFESRIYAGVKSPSDEEIKSIYDNNLEQIGNRSLDEMRTQIVGFLRREPEQRAFEEFIAGLKNKYKVVLIKSVSSKNLINSDVLATVGAKQITLKEFIDRNGAKLADFEGEQFDELTAKVDEVLFDKLVEKEAESLNLKASELIAREITDKLREFTAEERTSLGDSFKKKLFIKYAAKIQLVAPSAFVQSISTDDDPAKGNANSAVTVVMFTDFQCPACAAVHPALKRAINGFGDNVRFVVRDFPLVSIHDNAFRAAVAANAANAQGKFFEYTELLYKNQDKLDDASLKRYASELGLNIERFALDLENEIFANEVRKDIADGAAYGISSTPSVFVNGVKVRILSFQSFKEAIEKAVRK